MRYQVRETTMEDLPRLAAVMRSEDALECAALGMPPLAMLEVCLASSIMSAIAYIDDTPVCAVGLMPIGTIATDRGQPWLFTGYMVDETPREFLRWTRHFVAKMLEYYPFLENYVDMRYKRCHRWLSVAGFQLDEPIPYGVNGEPFRRFWMERRNVAA